MRRVVIVGASAAGFFTAEGLRQNGFSGEIIVAGDEPPYDRPPLSKQVLNGSWAPERSTLMPPQRQAAIDATALIGKRAVQADIVNRFVKFADGDRLDFDELVIATGARPRKLPGCDIPGVHTLRTLDDAIALRKSILDRRRLLIIGAGFIGLEVAASAVAMGAEVIVIEPTANPLASRLGPLVAERLVRRHVEAGIDLRLGVAVTEISQGETTNTTVRVGLGDGSMIEAGAVLVGIGCEPVVDWLAGSGLDVDNGVSCDAFCAAAPGVWAAGDVARWHHLGLQRAIRIEHRTNASEQGLAVARNIAGMVEPFTPVPFFWTDQYEVKIQLAGLIPEGCVGEIEYGDTDAGSFIQTFRQNGTLVAVVAWNAAKQMAAFRRELRFDAPAAMAAIA